MEGQVIETKTIDFVTFFFFTEKVPKAMSSFIRTRFGAASIPATTGARGYGAAVKQRTNRPKVIYQRHLHISERVNVSGVAESPGCGSPIVTEMLVMMMTR